MTEDRDDTHRISELELARLIRELDPELQPDRDLWAGIQRRIIDAPQKQRRDRQFWMPYAVAASLLIAVSALLMNVVQWQKADSLYQQAGFDLIQKEYTQVRTPMYEEFTRVNASLDDGSKNELERNLEIIADARRGLETLVQANPNNSRLRELLVKIQEQELALLTQDFSRSTRSL